MQEGGDVAGEGVQAVFMCLDCVSQIEVFFTK